MAEQNRVYGWHSGDGEYVGAFATPEEAADDLYVGDAQPGDRARIGYGETVDPLLLLAHAIPIVDTVLEAVTEYAIDDVGLCAEDFPQVSQGAQVDLARKLRAAVMCWGREHGVTADFWRLEGELLLTRTEHGWCVEEVPRG